MKQYQPQLGELLRGYRAERGFSQETLAQVADVDVRTVRSVELGKPIRDTKLAAICRALDLDVGELRHEALRLKEATTLKEASQKAARIPQAGLHAIDRNPDFQNLSGWLDAIDESVASAVGALKSPTRADDLLSFSSRRLITSLSSLGIPLDIILLIVKELPGELRDTVSDGTFSTNHIRRCVARIISGLSTATIQATESYKERHRLASHGGKSMHISAHEIKFDWVSRYARRYGSPDQIIQVLERDGSSSRLDYDFLRNKLIPHVLKRMLGQDLVLESNKIISRRDIDEIARTALEEFKRIGVYLIRYKTALRLIEDLAIQPPHPWLVTPETRKTTIGYDLGRAHAHLSGLEDEHPISQWDAGYHYEELLHHLCSAILAIYSGFLGHRDTSSAHLLKSWLGMEEENYLLWRSCDLRLIDSDLAEIKLSKFDFSSLLKRMELAGRTAARRPREELIDYGKRLMKIAQQLEAVRDHMSELRTRLVPGRRPDPNAFDAIARETVVACLGCRRVASLTGQIGLRAVLRTERSLLATRSALAIFLYCLDPDDPAEVALVIERALEQLAHHKLADTCIVLCVDEPPAALVAAAADAARALSGPLMIRAASLLTIREQMKGGAPTEEIIDEIMCGAAG